MLVKIRNLLTGTRVAVQTIQLGMSQRYFIPDIAWSKKLMGNVSYEL